MLDLLVFAFFFVTLELIYLYDPAKFVIIAPLMVFLLVLFHKLDKIEYALSEQKRNAVRAFQEKQKTVAGVALIGTLIMCGLVYVLYERGYLPRASEWGGFLR